MRMSDALLSVAQSGTELKQVRQAVDQGIRHQMVYGLTGSQRSFFMAGLARATNRPLLVITEGLPQAQQAAEQLEAFLGDQVAVFPPLEVLPYEIIAYSPELLGQRLSVLARLRQCELRAVVTTAGALLRRLLPVRVFDSATLRISWGATLALEETVAQLVEMGYERTDMVEGPGHFSRRGGIVDIFPVLGGDALRVEFFGDEVDSIRRLDPTTQRSVENLTEAIIYPAHEFLLDPASRETALAAIARERDALFWKLRKLEREAQAQALLARINHDLESLAEGLHREGLEQYAPFYYPDLGFILDYFAEPPVVCVDEPIRLREAAGRIQEEAGAQHAHLLEQGKLLPTQGELYLSVDQMLASLTGRAPTVYFSLLLRPVPGVDPGQIVSVPARPMISFHNQPDTLLDEVKRHLEAGRRLVLAVGTDDRRKRLLETLHAAELVPGPPGSLLDGRPGLYFLDAYLDTGFELPSLGLVLISEANIFGQARRRRRKARPRDGQRLTNYENLKMGDYVVHSIHGIGKYLGIRTLEIQGVTKDYLTIKYADEDRLYVPTDQIELVQKYVGAEGAEPKLYKLGGNDWNKVKSRVRASVRDMAQELLKLYAEREAVSGHQFSPDTVWQAEFEDAFRYEETPDQLRAAAEIKEDMEKPRPMDRLLCGDVGYGKTEVAMRAAFKAVMDGKQVAVLVPTTILAQQHFVTFSERLSGYPIRIDLLSRFRSPKEQRETVKRLGRGQVDIVIGTHRLVQADIRFKDLGLLIVDEEHRFGVAHKERLKQLRKNVDVLSLSATPIPRTLHMSMVGMRDMSVIETPPEDRFPVQTYVAESSDDLIREVIQRELHRNGQVFFVHNRVQDIQRVADRLGKLLPDARIGVGHGQMSEDQLEKVMLDFLEGEYDVLVCTTIIESGLDIANVNTIIIDDADKLGLAQLYQLRGRVGRSNRLAYAYFIYRREKVLSEVAEKRLQALKDFTELGAGFRIAMRDLEIRGAGNILGPEQHGHIVSVGFDLYCRLLEEAIAELRGEKPPEPAELTIDLPVDAHIPVGYIADSMQKVEFYKKVAAAADTAELDEVAEEIEDRFGEPLPAVHNLLTVARLRIIGRNIGLATLAQGNEGIVLRFHAERALPAAILSTLARQYRGKILFNPNRASQLVIRQGRREKPDLDELLRVLDSIAQLRASFTQ